MGTAKQLISTFVDAQPIYWERSYIKNMRPLRDYPNYFRITDTVGFVDGPPQEGQPYTEENVVWRVEIELDEDNNKTNKINVYNILNTLTSTKSVLPDGTTQYQYKYKTQTPDFTLTHTDIVDAVSLEFDQSGQRLLVFESSGEIFLNWFDPQAQDVVTTSLGMGRTPVMASSTCQRTGSASDSERFIFYVDSATNQIVGRRSLDRYLTDYPITTSPGDVVELLQVTKNIYGALLIVGCYESSPGVIEAFALQEKHVEDSPVSVLINSDVYTGDNSFSHVDSIQIDKLRLYEADVLVTQEDDGPIPYAHVDSLVIDNLQIKSKIINYTMPGIDDAGSSHVDSLSIDTLTVENKVIDYTMPGIDDAGSSHVDSFIFDNLDVYPALLEYILPEVDPAGSSHVDSLTINTLTVG